MANFINFRLNTLGIMIKGAPQAAQTLYMASDGMGVRWNFNL